MDQLFEILYSKRHFTRGEARQLAELMFEGG